MPSILDEKIVFHNKLLIEQAEIRDDRQDTYTRLRIKREDAAAVLLFNTDSNKIILTKQFRYPIADRTTEWILELLAGKVDPGETPLEAAIREGEEETGYIINKENIHFLLSCFTSPRYSSERIH
jgi:nudix-type nucleoside diphosphatase (YffH/AdpP family)